MKRTRKTTAETGATRRPRRRRRRETSSTTRSNRRSSWTLEDARRTAHRRFGIRRLRREQEQALHSLLAGRDTLAVLPTGYGKSLLYQIPALLFDSPTLAISPLIALMQDQESFLRARGIPVVRLDSTLRKQERVEALARIAAGGALVVLTTPETLESEDAQAALVRSRPRLLCVDEAHCISEWGHQFRPSYLRLGAERHALRIPQALALTATATPRVRQDLARRLRLKTPDLVLASPHRPNLHLAAFVVPGGHKIDHAGRLLRRLTRPGIVYSATKQGVDDIYGALVRARIPCARYHGGMTSRDRTDEQQKFMRGRRRMVMVATSAFGMGIDKPDIRYIMHFHPPASPEQYLQEAGRAGRDGRRSRCILLFDPADLAIHEYLQTKGRPKPSQLKRVARALTAWAERKEPVDPKTLALSAGVSITTTRLLLAQLEQCALVERQRGKGYAAIVNAPTLAAGANDLAKRYEIQRGQDAGRLEGVQEYAETDACRSVFLRRWFGESDPPPCGTCDRCRAHRRSPSSSPTPPSSTPSSSTRSSRRKRRPRRRR